MSRDPNNLRGGARVAGSGGGGGGLRGAAATTEGREQHRQAEQIWVARGSVKEDQLWRRGGLAYTSAMHTDH